MSIQSLSISKQYQPSKATVRMEKYSSVFEPEVRKAFSSSPLIMRDSILGDRVEFLGKRNKEHKAEKELTEALISEKYSEISKLTDQLIGELNAASREAEAYFDMQKAQVRALSQKIIAEYNSNTASMDPAKARKMLQSSLASLSSGLPSNILSRLNGATSGLGALHSKSSELSGLTLTDEFLTRRINSNSFEMATAQAKTGTNFVRPSFESTYSLGRIFTSAVNSIVSSVRSIFFSVATSNSVSKNSIESTKDDSMTRIKPKENEEFTS